MWLYLCGLVLYCLAVVLHSRFLKDSPFLLLGLPPGFLCVCFGCLGRCVVFVAVLLED